MNAEIKSINLFMDTLANFHSSALLMTQQSSSFIDLAKRETPSIANKFKANELSCS
jgi:hypothetical protein